MSVQPVQVFVETPQAVPFVEALLRPYAVQVHSSFTSSGTISKAEGSLLDYPERPVVLLLNAETENKREVADIRMSAKRIMARAYPENWYVGMAIPYLDAWARTDPRIRQELDSSPDGEIYLERLDRIAGLIKDHPFDATELHRGNADFRGLIEFLQKHASASATPAVQAASS